MARDVNSRAIPALWVQRGELLESSKGRPLKKFTDAGRKKQATRKLGDGWGEPAELVQGPMLWADTYSKRPRHARVENRYH